jgi:glycosyltransferase involved in cell wall biosynthesis
VPTDDPGVIATIIVPLSGDAESARPCFQALAALPAEPRFRVVVVDNGATGVDGVLALLDGDVDLVRLPARAGLAVAAGAALERAGGDVIVLLRDAGEVQPGWLAPLMSTLRDPGVAAVASVVADAPHGTPAVGAPALAWRRADLAAVPPVDDALVVAALCAELARQGDVEVAAESAVRLHASAVASAAG